MSSYTFYFAGELFSQKHLIGNALLAQAIHQQSEGKYLPILPQDLEFRDNSPQAIRDQDLVSLIQSDLALFHFDGPELDSGTVAEFMTAKFADIPSVIIRTDFRDAGDQAGNGEPWNLMCSFYPRTKTVLAPSVQVAEATGHQRQTLENYNSSLIEENLQAQRDAIEATATQIISAFEAVLQEAPILKAQNQQAVYEQLASFANFKTPAVYAESILKALHTKRERGLL
jgi:hypothetical protein